MAGWTGAELENIGAAEELELASRRQNGTLRKPVTIWVVRVGNDLFVRSVNGRDSSWFRGVLVRREGRIWAGGVEKEVAFVEEPDPAINDQIDAAYLAKYRRYPQYVAPMVTPQVKAATIRLLPQEAGHLFGSIEQGRRK